MPKANKRQKRSEIASRSAHKQDLFSHLPMELLTEILYLISVRDILAVARTSRHFCNTLVSKRSDLIWKNARNQCDPPLPDPTPNFTEASFAAYIFDGGHCDTQAMWKIYSLLLLFVFFAYSALSCESGLHIFLSKPTYACVYRWIKENMHVVEETHFPMHCLEPQNQSTLKSLHSHVDFLDRTNNSYNNTAIHAKSGPQLEMIMKLSTELVDWRNATIKKTFQVKRVNHKFTNRIALKNGWTFTRLRNSPSFSALIRRQNASLERINDSDYDAVEDAIKKDIFRAEARKERSMKEENLRIKRKIIEVDYNSRKSRRSRDNLVVLPTLNEFYKLPCFDQLLKDLELTPETLTINLNNSSVLREIDNHLSVWLERAKIEFAEMLGFQEYDRIQENELHPAEITTALFVCKRCIRASIQGSTTHNIKDANQHEVLDQQGDTKAQEGSSIPGDIHVALGKYNIASLTFVDACEHICPAHSMRKGKRDEWSPKNFLPDTKAISATRKCLSLLKASEENEASTIRKLLNEGPPRILCNSCDGKITLTLDALYTHSHRHEEMQMEILSIHEAENQLPVEWGLYARLMSRGNKYNHWKLKKNFRCRHCLSLTNVVGQKKSQTTERKYMTFDGIGCHLKAKHGITIYGDEDFIVSAT